MRPTNHVLSGPGVIAESQQHGGADEKARFEAAGDGETRGAVASQREVGSLVPKGSGNPGVAAVSTWPGARKRARWGPSFRFA